MLEASGCIVYCKPEISRGSSSTPNLSILIAYPHSNKNKRASSLVNSQHKLNSMVGGEAQDQQKTNTTYGFLK